MKAQGAEIPYIHAIPDTATPFSLILQSTYMQFQTQPLLREADVPPRRLLLVLPSEPAGGVHPGGATAGLLLLLLFFHISVARAGPGQEPAGILREGGHGRSTSLLGGREVRFSLQF